MYKYKTNRHAIPVLTSGSCNFFVIVSPQRSIGYTVPNHPRWMSLSTSNCALTIGIVLSGWKDKTFLRYLCSELGFCKYWIMSNCDMFLPSIRVGTLAFPRTIMPQQAFIRCSNLQSKEDIDSAIIHSKKIRSDGMHPIKESSLLTVSYESLMLVFTYHEGIEVKQGPRVLRIDIFVDLRLHKSVWDVVHLSKWPETFKCNPGQLRPRIRQNLSYTLTLSVTYFYTSVLSALPPRRQVSKIPATPRAVAEPMDQFALASHAGQHLSWQTVCVFPPTALWSLSTQPVFLAQTTICHDVHTCEFCCPTYLAPHRPARDVIFAPQGNHILLENYSPDVIYIHWYTRFILQFNRRTSLTHARQGLHIHTRARVFFSKCIPAM